MKRNHLPTGDGRKKVFLYNRRYLFAWIFYRQEKDITRLADSLGQQSVNTTRGYVSSSKEKRRVQIEALRLAVQKCVCLQADDIILYYVAQNFAGK